ncbi:hypothetical protein PsAD2_02864 [Pseudovibrio axinellae]|uniref:Outer membrane protein beta-barrel domain-containing protein n=1 Tax=Pseudovibrio axinellae TaxID=989403 RepID=A0A165XML6_9HYPH|nr:acyloxyacyl hydrolase [Pseudovibrio axinellae]KZL17862.1 hypothetical protein PsAD2_02864 [Pseudovibrio axinellae]SER86064.1 hypothetical protein SAMN05421798_1403 [Pseudovibrio axinellae]
MQKSHFRLVQQAGLLLGFIGAFLPCARAADLASQHLHPGPASNWRFTLQPYFLPPTINGDTTVGRLPNVNINVGANDILQNLRFGIMFHAEALYKSKVGVGYDLAYMNIGRAADQVLPQGRLRASMGQLIMEVFGFVRVFDTPQFSADLLAGGRYWDNGLKFEVSGSLFGDFQIKPQESWVDPFIGGRVAFNATEQIVILARADIGGFDVSSSIAWLLQGGLGYTFNDSWQATLEYKALSVDFHNDRSGQSEYSYDTITHGPLVSVAFSF